MTKVTVLGATGTTGSLVTRGLRAGGHDVRPASRTAPVHFDWDDRTTWAQAIGDSSAVYIIPDERPGGVDRLTAFLDVAARQAAERVVLLSARDWIDTDLPDGHLREQSVVESGLDWTIIRPAWFAQDFLTIECFARGLRDGRVVYGSGEGATAFVDAGDIADVAVAALTDPVHGSRYYELSGPRSLSVPEAARLIGTATGRTVALVPVDAHGFDRYLREIGYADDEMYSMQFFCRAMLSGELDYVSSGVREALGRPATTFEDFSAGAAGDQRWAATNQI